MDAVTTRHRITVEEFLRMGEAGIFDEDARIELIDGELVEMSPIGDRHAKAVFRLTQILGSLMPKAGPSVQNPLIVSRHTLPQPDLILLRTDPDPYRDGHPRAEDVLLVVEVADSSLAKDRRVKLPRYAAAGVRETWIVNLSGEAVEIGRGPGPDGYRDLRRVGREEPFSPEAFPELTLTFADLA